MSLYRDPSCSVPHDFLMDIETITDRSRDFSVF